MKQLFLTFFLFAIFISSLIVPSITAQESEPEPEKELELAQDTELEQNTELDPAQETTLEQNTELELAASYITYLPYVQAQTTFAQQVLQIVNEHRAVAGCAPLTYSSQLERAAYLHSQDMALQNFFSHQGSDGSTLGVRITRQGYRWTRVGENIAAGQRTPAAVMASWMASDGHRRNILNCAYTEMGLGYYYEATDTRLNSGGGPYYHYWTQDFGTR